MIDFQALLLYICIICIYCIYKKKTNIIQTFLYLPSWSSMIQSGSRTIGKIVSWFLFFFLVISELSLPLGSMVLSARASTKNCAQEIKRGGGGGGAGCYSFNLANLAFTRFTLSVPRVLRNSPFIQATRHPMGSYSASVH